MSRLNASQLLAASLLLMLGSPNRLMGAAELPAPARIEFNRDVRPILSDNCFHCHGPDNNARKAELRLDIREAGNQSSRVRRDANRARQAGRK